MRGEEGGGKKRLNRWVSGKGEEGGSRAVTRSGLMARIEHPVGVFSGACTRSLAEIVREFIRGKWGGEDGGGGRGEGQKEEVREVEEDIS